MRFAALLAIAAAAPAFAQSSPYRLEIRIDRPVLEPGETTTVELRGWYPGDGWNGYLGAFQSSVLTDAGEPVLSDPALIVPFAGPGTLAGTPTTSGVEEIRGGFLCCPLVDCQLERYPNPWRVWAATFTAPDASEPTEVALWTASDEYVLYFQGCRMTESVIDQLAEGEAIITIVPCRADLDGDGQATLFDFLAFQNAFDAGDPLADFDFDGELTVFDFLAFQNRFDAGC